jgi:hypothetical protein
LAWYIITCERVAKKGVMRKTLLPLFYNYKKYFSLGGVVLERKWHEYDKDEKVKIVNEFLEYLKTKLLDEDTYEVNLDLTKGVTKFKLWGINDKIYNGKETIVIRINHTGELEEMK